MSDNEEDGIFQLSTKTMAILQEFFKERDEQERKLKLENDVDDFQEDWQLSQFWYDDETNDALCTIAEKSIGDGGKVALISCPSLYRKLKERLTKDCEVHVYEYDKRFASFGSDFHRYDYKSPLDVPRDRSSYYDLVIADPPFLSDECLTKTAVTIKFLTKKNIVLCTGAVMADMAKKLLDLNKAKFEPQHESNLSNAFWCYSNYNIDELL